MAGKQDIAKQETYYRNAWAGDYSQFEKLSPEGRNDLAAQYMNEISRHYPTLGKAPLETHDFDGLLQEQAMNPVFRLGCSLGMRSGEGVPQYFQQYDDYMNSYIMKQSLSPLDKNRLQNLKDQGLTGDRLNNAVSQNVEKQTMLAKTLFLAHLGDAHLLTGKPGETPQRQELNRPVSSMAAHCSRTAYVFPPGGKEQQEKLFGAILGPDMGKGADVFRRMAATHSVSSGPTINDFREEKKFSMVNQYGMNIAIGGAGNPGIGGPGGPQTLKNDGSCGHMYMHIDKGGVDKCSSLLVGFESDAPGVANQQGHTHDAKATPETMSSFLGQRSDEMGMKYGGRIVDCTHLDPDKLERAVNQFASHYRTLLTEGMANSDVRGELDKINSALCGNPMNGPELGSVMGSMGIEKGNIMDVLSLPGQAPLNVAPAPCVSGLNFAQAAPKKPGFFTRLKASFGSAEAKKACQEHKDYQASLAGRAEKGLDTGAPKGGNNRGSLQQLAGDMGKDRWKAAVPDNRMAYAYGPAKPVVGIGRQRQPEAAAKQILYVPNAATGREARPKEEQASYIPPRREAPAPEPQAMEDRQATFIPPQREAPAQPQQNLGGQEASYVPPRRDNPGPAPQAMDGQEASYIPPRRNNQDQAHRVPCDLPELDADRQAAPSKRRDSLSQPQKGKDLLSAPTPKPLSERGMKR